ncbi:MAG TPA: M12 family metallo-peptidase [Phycisphaerales bacterium]|nr:M12 family metallo-peptidase [Phycisphaerales bacterium]HMP37335.1 M12 family metallo-peptidase [Phycisphaerales bacterium]
MPRSTTSSRRAAPPIAPSTSWAPIAAAAILVAAAQRAHALDAAHPANPEAAGPRSLAEAVLRATLDGAPVELTFTPLGLRSSGFRLLVQGDDGALTEVGAPPPRTVRGTAAGRPDLLAAGSLRDAGLDATVTIDGIGTWALRGPGEGALRADDGAGVATAVTSWRSLSLPPGACAALDPWAAASAAIDGTGEALRGIVDDGGIGPPTLRGIGRSGHVDAVEGLGGVAGATCPRICQIAFDTDYEYFLANGSSIEETVADIESILAGMLPIFESQLGVTFVLTAIIVRTSPEDPYTADAFLPLLHEIKDEWGANFADVPRDLAHLMTDRVVGSTLGAAWVQGACTEQFHFGWSRSKFSTDYAVRVFLTSHEVGHNLGATHDCGQPDCGIMCGTSCSTTLFSLMSKLQIGIHLGNTTCIVPEPADLDGDCAVGAADLGLLLANWGGSGPGDLDGDGFVGPGDLGILLAAWSR